jgi:hypothetical protein
MSRTARRSVFGLALVLGCWLLAGAERNGAAENREPAVPLTDADFNRLVEQSSKLIQDSLRGNPNDPAVERARTAAILVAAFAQYGPAADTPRRTALRDTALRLGDALKRNKLDIARKEAATLARLPADAKGKPESVPLMDKRISLAEVMNHFAEPADGGVGLSKRLKALMKQGRDGALPRAALNDEVALLALQLAALGELVKGHTDNKVAKKPRDWKEHSDDLRRSGLDLAKAARAKDGKAAWKALNQLDDSCAGCHAKFKP